MRAVDLRDAIKHDIQLGLGKSELRYVCLALVCKSLLQCVEACIQIDMYACGAPRQKHDLSLRIGVGADRKYGLGFGLGLWADVLSIENNILTRSR